MPHPSPSVPLSPDRTPPITRLSTFLLQGDAALAAWERFDDENTDLDGWPYDQDTYNARQAEKDAALWHRFSPLREQAAALLDAAETSADQLVGKSGQARWSWQLAHLRGALERVDTAHTEYERVAADPSTSAEDLLTASAVRNKQASEALVDWLTHGRAVLEIHAATVRAGQSGIRLTTRTPHAATTASPARRR
ncbi:hypothetical protein [Streptomyces sp. NRRL F-5193]|uniref:hypothetical protein n=1 Tax=Streptomyces sp. NRRL F-5193 TaxID=1463860 RepID=UPI00068B3E52|nr:hypothetical protein [Streptomyces sp. NRRL F-5193]